MTRRVEQAAEQLKALGHPVRLSILRRVVQGPEAGTPAGELQTRLDIPASTLSHHLAALAEAGLVQVAREGTTLRYRADYRVLRALRSTYGRTAVPAVSMPSPNLRPAAAGTDLPHSWDLDAPASQ